MEQLQPPPIYTPLVARPSVLEENENYKNQLEFKKNLRTSMKDSFYFIEQSKSETTDFNSSIERYSDRYTKLKKASINDWLPAWNRLPKELKHFYDQEDKIKKKRKSNVAPNLLKRKVKKEIDLDKIAQIIAQGEEDNEENEDNDEEAQKEKKSEKGSEDEDNEQVENADEEDIEEENDYIDTYFDNGENYGDDDLGGDDEGPTY